MKFKIKYADQIVGTLSIIAIAALVFIIFFIGSTQKWFVQKHPFYSIVSSASGVSEGMSIQYKGFGIGKVKKISLDEDDNVKVHFYILDDYIEKVTEGSIVELSSIPVVGSSFTLYPGLSSKIIEDDSHIPERSSPEAAELIHNNKVSIGEKTDIVSSLLSTVPSILNHVDELLLEFTDILAGNQNLPLAQTVNDINTILEQISAFLAGDSSVPMTSIIDELSNSVNTINAILGDLNGITSDPQGLIPKLLESEDSKGSFDKLYATVNTTIADLNGISGSLDSEMPQISLLMAQVQTLLREIQDVMIGLKNNPILKNGVPERMEQQSITPKLREDKF